MAYTNQAAILSQIQYSDLVRLTDDNGTGDIDQTVLDSVITSASNLIDSYISNIYDTPLSPVTSTVEAIALDITCYMLYRRRLVPDEKNNFTELFNRRMNFLEKVNSGEMRLDKDDERAFSQVQYNARPTIFGTGNVLPNSM